MQCCPDPSFGGPSTFCSVLPSAPSVSTDQAPGVTMLTRTRLAPPGANVVLCATSLKSSRARTSLSSAVAHTRTWPGLPHASRPPSGLKLRSLLIGPWNVRTSPHDAASHSFTTPSRLAEARRCAVGAKGQREDALLAGVYGSRTRLRTRVPDSQRLIPWTAGAADDPAAVRRKREAKDWVAVAEELEPLLTRLRVPHADPAPNVAGRQVLAVGAERSRDEGMQHTGSASRTVRGRRAAPIS